jgi:hypothetical protein
MNMTDSKKSQLKSKLERAKTVLEQAIRRLLDLNKMQKKAQESAYENAALKQEIKLLNRIADQQAHLVKVYEYQLSSDNLKA